MFQLLLAVDTSGKNGSLALARLTPGQSDSEISVLEVVPLAGGAFSAQLVPQIAALLKKHGYSKTDLGAFAVASGPGSFTGLRVGLAAIKALAEALQKPIVAISLLEAVACSGAARGRVLAALDAGRGDVYVGDYELEPQVRMHCRMHSERLLSMEEFLADARGKAVVTPDAVAEVENARETVLPDGTIQGVLSKDAPVGRIDNLLDKMGSTGSEMEKLGGKTFGKADPSIDFPAGTDLVLTLDQPLAVDSTSPPAAATQISPALAEAVQKLLADAPNRCESKAKKPGDPLNLVIVGNSDQILNAYKQAGWSEATKLARKSAVGTARAVWDDEGYGQAPVSQLYLYGHMEDLAFEKMLNTFMKRHHLRLWRTTVTTADGREIWLGASTHDIGLDVHPGVVSHAVDPDLDAERDKVGADLKAGGMVAAEQLVTRRNPLSEGKTATGGTWRTDGQLLVIELKNSGAI